MQSDDCVWKILEGHSLPQFCTKQSPALCEVRKTEVPFVPDGIVRHLSVFILVEATGRSHRMISQGDKAQAKLRLLILII